MGKNRFLEGVFGGSIYRDVIGFLTRTGLTTWSTSENHVPRTFLRLIGMRRLHFGMIPRTVPGLPKINKRAKSKVDEMLRLQGLGSNNETGVPYTEYEIMAIVREGKQRGSDDNFSQMLTQLESQLEISGGSGSDGCEDDEQGDDEDDGEDGEDEDDS
ncbi:hypothetical protein Tco_0180659 [Tanacetum coccineum]